MLIEDSDIATERAVILVQWRKKVHSEAEM